MLRQVLLLFIACVSGVDRRPEVQSVLDRHEHLLGECCSYLLQHFGADVLHIPLSVPLPKQPFVPARESTLVPASLSMVAAARAAVQLSFPFSLPIADPLLLHIIDEIVAFGASISKERSRRQRCLSSASRMILPVTRDLQSLVSDFARPIAGHVNFGLIECMVRVCRWPFAELVDSLIYGFQPVYKVPFVGCHRPVDEPSTLAPSRDSNVRAFDDAVEHLQRKAARAAPGSQALLDMVEVWDITCGEVDRDLCVGPLSRGRVESMFKGSPYGPRPIPAFGIWQKGKLRRIDDALRSGHNSLTHMLETIVCISAEFPASVAAAFARRVPLDRLRLRIGTDDIASAYRILNNACPEYSVAAVWRPAERCSPGEEPGVAYFALRGFNFGLKSAPLHLATLMRALIEFARKFGLISCGDFYDDVVVVDPAEGGSSAQRILNFIFSLLGFPFAPKKHERLRYANPFLGMVTDFSYLAAGYVVVRVKEQRRRRLIRELRDVLASGQLYPAHAARLRGKLYFTTCSSFFGIGRPALQSFTARQYAKRSRHYPITPSLRASISFFIALLENLPPSKRPLVPDDARPLYVWSDAMWEPLYCEGGRRVTAIDEVTGSVFYIANATIAFVCFDPSDGTWHESSMPVSLQVLRHLVPGKLTYIGQLEALAAEFFLETMPSYRLLDRSAIFWIDNLSAKYGLQKAYSKVEDSGRIINAFKVKQASLRLRSWFEYVPSAQNIADLPSRGRWDKLMEVIDEISGHEWIMFSYRAVLPDFSSWTAPLAALPRRKRQRHGSRGAKRRRGPSSADASVSAGASS